MGLQILEQMSAQFDFSKAVQRPPPTSKGVNKDVNPPGSKGGRLGTMSRQNENRPITSNKSAGFGNETKTKFGTTANKFRDLEKKEGEKQMEPEKKNKKYEKEIDGLIDESAI